jgi:hypothetical protein
MPNGQAEKPFTITREQIIARLWELASLSHEQTNGNFEGQISACKNLYEKVEYAPAIQRLNEIANLDPSETGGRQADQKAAAEALREILGSVKPDKSGVQ